MEIFYEQNLENPQIEKHAKRTTFLNVLRYVLLVLGILVAIFITMQPATEWKMSMVVFLLVFAVLSATPFVLAFFLIGRYIQRSNLEYDYRIDNGVLRIIKVIRRKNRKIMATVQLSSVESMGRVTCDAYERYTGSKGIKKLFAICSYDDEDAIIYLRYRSEGEDFLLHLEPDEEMLTALKRSLPRMGIIDKSLNMPVTAQKKQ